MNRCLTAPGWFGTFILLVCISLANTTLAQDHPYPNPRGMFVAMHLDEVPSESSPHLAQWRRTFTDVTGVKRSFTMVGTDPSRSNDTTTIPVIFIPIRMVFDQSHGNKIFDPNKAKFEGTHQSVSETILASPIFQSNVDFVQGGTDLGRTQYIDAFQRANFWGKNVRENTNYHVLLGKPTIVKEQTINCSDSSCTVGTEFGKTVGLADMNFFFEQLQTLLEFKQINPGVLPIFLTYDVYLTSGGCCIGGFHGSGSEPGGQTYAYTTVVDQGSQVFAQDTAALSHEIGEWMDDPFVDNVVGCNDNSILEVGDPLVLDDHEYLVGSFTYHLQDLVFMPYFGAPGIISLHKWFSFQNDKKTICPGQG